LASTAASSRNLLEELRLQYPAVQVMHFLRPRKLVDQLAALPECERRRALQGLTDFFALPGGMERGLHQSLY
jgi:hypothetical protein